MVICLALQMRMVRYVKTKSKFTAHLWLEFTKKSGTSASSDEQAGEDTGDTYASMLCICDGNENIPSLFSGEHVCKVCCKRNH